MLHFEQGWGLSGGEGLFPKLVNLHPPTHPPISFFKLITPLNTEGPRRTGRGANSPGINVTSTPRWQAIGPVALLSHELTPIYINSCP